MAVWCLILVLLGFWGLIRDLLALDLPGFLNPISNVAIMLVALGLLIRTRSKAAAGSMEGLEARIASLERELKEKSAGV